MELYPFFMQFLIVCSSIASEIGISRTTLDKLFKEYEKTLNNGN